MAHESFEDPAVAADLSRWFVSVKVDREERPDVDAVYMAAVLAMSGSGGWPMSVFCTPDGRPFFGGTYFPPTERAGHAVVPAAAGRAGRRLVDPAPEVEAQADALLQAAAGELDLADRLAAARPPGEEARWPEPEGVLERAVAELAERFDPEWGGFGPAPKFPRPTLVELCLRHHRAPATTPPSPWPPPPSTPWPPAASTTTWPGASPATRPTAVGWSRTSRRC